MYIVEFYYETNIDLIKDYSKNFESYKIALMEAKKFVKNSLNKSAYIYRGLEESRELLTEIHIDSTCNFIDTRWLS